MKLPFEHAYTPTPNPTPNAWGHIIMFDSTHLFVIVIGVVVAVVAVFVVCFPLQKLQ